MADVLVYLVTGTADLACTNCNTTQTHRVRLYWNDTNKKIQVERKCVCQDVVDLLVRYKEDRETGILGAV